LSTQYDTAYWRSLSDSVADLMTIYTRPFVTILAGKEIGTGTFIEREGIKVLTCAHVAQHDPDVYFVDGYGSYQARPGVWCADPNKAVDTAFAPVVPMEWARLPRSAQPLPMSRFAERHAPVECELLFFRGIAGENATYVGPFGADVVISGYCSQEKKGTSDANIFEMLWDPLQASVTTGTETEISSKVKYVNPAGFSGSLVWNTRFVEKGCDFTKWTPRDAMVSGLVRRYDVKTKTLLGWRGEHLLVPRQHP
jgi:hypothetical protein